MVTIMITSALHRAADWAKSVFSSAALGDPRRTTRLVNVAAQLAQQCQGRCGEVQAIATAATGLACFIFRFLRRPLKQFHDYFRSQKCAGSLSISVIIRHLCNHLLPPSYLLRFPCNSDH